LRVKTLEKSHPWIDNEKPYFGQPGGNYDFTARDPEEAQKRLNDVKSAQDNISKKLNKKAIVLMEKAESEYQELSRKRDVILNDKAKIEAVIEELDIKKTQALQSTWVKVNRDFGSIFSTLLPGTFAKLEPLEGCSVMDGLQVKVSFNGVWKESLTELSGGQRSLLALSLILSLLLFKPAPMYILDEVDAALDLSHTQNIGLMLRTHFSTSQFIVVSLKEGMFNNANVIFRTKFVDGVSAVVRTVTGAAKSKAITNQENVQDENASPQKKRGKTTNQTKSKLAVSSRQMIENII
jgi:structural maintenance of chromosome 2